MKSFYLFCLLLLTNFMGYSQYGVLPNPEVEPNNSFATADTLALSSYYYQNCTIGGADNVDYHLANFRTGDGGIFFYVQATNNGASNSNITWSLYDGRQASGLMSSRFVGNVASVAPGQTVYDTISLCSAFRDNYFVKFNSTGNFAYRVVWDNISPYFSSDEQGTNNDTRVTAYQFYTSPTIMEDQLGFTYRGVTDTIDYWKDYIGDGYGSHLRIKANYAGCNAIGTLHYECFKNEELVPFASGDMIPNGFNMSTSARVSFTGFESGDNFYIKLWSSDVFNYTLEKSYDYDSFDEEPNNDIATAISISAGAQYGGIVGEYDDASDFYRIIMPHAGTASFEFISTNLTCDGESVHFYYNLYNKNGNKIGYINDIIDWSNGEPCNEGYYQEVKLRGLEKDTFYLELFSDERVDQLPGRPASTNQNNSQNATSGLDNPHPVEYYFTLSYTDSTSSEVEPNNTREEAINISENETKKGYLNFKRLTTYDDPRDVYKATLEKAGTLNLTLKTKLRSFYNFSYSTSSDLNIKIGNSTTTTRTVPSNVSYSRSDTLYIETIVIPVVAAGTIYFELFSDESREYEISYNMTDTFAVTETEPNDTRFQANVVQPGSTNRATLLHVYTAPYDGEDWFVMPVPAIDTVKLYIKATNKSALYNGTLNFTGSKQTGAPVTYFNKNAGGTIIKGETIYDSIIKFLPTTDSLFIRVSPSQPFTYEFSLSGFVPTSSFLIVGDSTVCLNGQQYKATGISQSDITYNWSLPNGGGTISGTDSVIIVNWNTVGTFPLKLYLSNAKGNSVTKTINVIVNSVEPPVAPTIFNFARNLSTSPLPPGTYVQWYRNGVIISGGIDSLYYASLGGNYTARFINDCGPGPVSNPYNFPNDVIAQTITLPHTANVPMAPQLRIKLPATASSGLPVFYTKISGPGTITNDSLSISGVGQIIIKAQQPGNDVYSAAAEKFDTITVVKGTQIISFEPIQNQLYKNGNVVLSASSSSQLQVVFIIVSGNAAMSGNRLLFYGVGNVTVQALQGGSVNYNAATPVSQTFCIGIDTLPPIIGASAACLNTYTYRAPKMSGANYVWTLSEGGTITTNNDTAFVTWNVGGTHTISVKANSTCETSYGFSPVKEVTVSDVYATPVTTMMPANNTIEAALPLTLSWLPGDYTENYDIYIWDSALSQPVNPFRSNNSGSTYTIVQNALAYNKTYKWRVVSKNPCSSASGPIQTFRLIPLPDLAVTSIQAPTSAISGQTISLSWTIKNVGPGKTQTYETWTDAVFLSFDTLTNFSINPQVNPNAWRVVDIPLKALLVAEKQNLSALLPGEQYTNSVDFTLPLNYQNPLYLYVVTNSGSRYVRINELTLENDTLFKRTPINVTLAPSSDLRVDSLFTPATVFSGSEINVTYKVKNYGVLTPPGSEWKDQVYLSQSILFDSINAIKLSLLNWEGSYYPYPPDASLFNNTQLQHDSVYTKTIKAVIPNELLGQWFIHVKTNDSWSLYEGPSHQNNTNYNTVQIYVTPTPKLTVQNINFPFTSVSTTQRIGFTYNIYNDGFYDNIEKNKGHYYTYKNYCLLPQPPCNKPPGQYCDIIPGMNMNEFRVYGGSYWADRIYLSKDADGLNISTALKMQDKGHGYYNSGWYVYEDPGCVRKGDPSDYDRNWRYSIAPGQSFPTTADFVIPDTLSEGVYYLYIYANFNKAVFEYPGTPQITRVGPFNIYRPDLIVPEISAYPTVPAGEQTVIYYDVKNIGNGLLSSRYRVDSLFMSNSPTFDASAVGVASKLFYKNIPINSSVRSDIYYTLPHGQSGQRYFFIKTNATKLFLESNYGNNVSASVPINFSNALEKDLIVTNISTDSIVSTTIPQKIKYTVKNNGSSPANGYVSDFLFIGCNNVFDEENVYKVSSLTKGRTIAAGGSYTDSIYVTVPLTYTRPYCFPNEEFNDVYFFIKTDYWDDVYEGVNENNNIGVSDLKILENQLTDLIVSEVYGNSNATVGRMYNVLWRLKNIGKNNGDLYTGRMDSVYLSTDSVLNNNAVFFAKNFSSRYVSLNEVLTFQTNKPFPNVPTGDYYILVKTNADRGLLSERNYANNVNLIRNEDSSAMKIHVVRNLLPDLTDSIISIPEIVAVGQPFTVIHRIKNIGAGESYPANFRIKSQITSDAIGDVGISYLGYKNFDSIIQPGQYIQDTLTYIMPIDAENRVYSFVNYIDELYQVVESNEKNNRGSRYITAYRPLPVDLIVQNVSAPDTVFLGYQLDSVRWVVKNNYSNPANGVTSDGIYLSANNNLDSNSVLIGIKEKIINMPALTSESYSFSPMVTGVKEGDYNIFIRTDLTSQLLETDKTNNDGKSLNKVHVKVKELFLNIAETNTLGKDLRFYKLVIPDSLNGATFSVKLTSNDSLTRTNQIFIGKGYIPTAANFDYTYPTSNYGNQNIVMAYATAGSYYIMIRAINPGGSLQNIKLLARKLPFEITKVESSTGGNIGNVTVKISGSLFTTGMTARLNKVGTQIDASAVYFTNSTIVYATFPLQGKPLGNYNVTLSKADTSIATLNNGFSVVNANNGGLITGGGNNTGAGDGNAPGCDPGAASGLNSQLITELLIPAKVFRGWPFTISVNFSNPTNFDIPAQIKTLYADDIIDLGFTLEDLNNHNHSISIEFTEKDGPPGIIRAGGSGTITIHAKSKNDVRPHTWTKFSFR